MRAATFAKTTPFVLLCGIALAGCATTSEESRDTDTSTAFSAPAQQPAPAPYTQDTTATRDSTVSNPSSPSDSTVIQTTSTPATLPTNSGINTRDREPGSVTAGMQGQGKSDVSMTADIRRRVLDDKSLSINAQNVKIITVNGQVTLRGPVNSQDEKDTIGRLAADAAGPENVDNLLDVQQP